MSLSKELGIDVTSTRDLLGNECWDCTKDQANVIASMYRGEAWRIWLLEEARAYQLADADEIQNVIDKKKQKPGPYLNEKGARSA